MENGCEGDSTDWTSTSGSAFSASFDATVALLEALGFDATAVPLDAPGPVLVGDFVLADAGGVRATVSEARVGIRRNAAAIAATAKMTPNSFTRWRLRATRPRSRSISMTFPPPSLSISV